MGRDWDLSCWRSLNAGTQLRAAAARSEPRMRRELVRSGRAVLGHFSSSFFLVTRFLPRTKREDVELIYAAVRYPDEIVDSFPLSRSERLALLAECGHEYVLALRDPNLAASLRRGAPWIVAGFADVARRCGIPPEHYRAFLDAMRRDAAPAPFRTLDDLISDYVYGSAIVVGYFLAHVYGPGPGRRLEQTLLSARALGIALQLTNFARDVAEDHRRGRLYLPLEMLAAEGLTPQNYLHPAHAAPLRRAIAALAAEAEWRYGVAEETLDTYAPDSRTAIRACIDVYRALNRRILASATGPELRHSVPAAEKFAVLPRSKYWRVPWAYLHARFTRPDFHSATTPAHADRAESQYSGAF